MDICVHRSPSFDFETAPFLKIKETSELSESENPDRSSYSMNLLAVSEILTRISYSRKRATCTDFVPGDYNDGSIIVVL